MKLVAFPQLYADESNSLWITNNARHTLKLNPAVISFVVVTNLP